MGTGKKPVVDPLEGRGFKHEVFQICSVYGDLCSPYFVDWHKWVLSFLRILIHSL